MKKNRKEILKNLGIKLKIERYKAGLTQEQLAEKMGDYYAQTVGAIERGEVNPGFLTILDIKNALNIDIAKLFDFEL